MSNSSDSTTPAVFVDTCVISGMAKGDLKSSDASAVVQMAEMVQRSELTIWASTVAREEIDQVPPEHRQAHIDQYEALRIIRASDATWVDTSPESTGFGLVVEHPYYRKLRDTLRDENDARLVFQAKMAGLTDFVTVDYKSILNKAPDIEENVGIRAVSPSQYVSSRST